MFSMKRCPPGISPSHKRYKRVNIHDLLQQKRGALFSVIIVIYRHLTTFSMLSQKLTVCGLVCCLVSGTLSTCVT